MEKRNQLLLAARIYRDKDYFAFHIGKSNTVEMVDIEIVEQTTDEFEHAGEERVNKIIFNHDEVYLCDPLLFVMLPDVLFNYLEIKEIDNGEDKTFKVVLKNITPADLMRSFQIAYNRIKHDEEHEEKSPKEYEDKIVREMEVFDK